MPAYHFLILSTCHSAILCASGCSYSFRAERILQWHNGHGYVVSKPIWMYILPFQGNRFNYCRSHYSHQLHIGGSLCTPSTPTTPLLSPQWGYLTIIGAFHSPSALISGDWYLNVSFCIPYPLVFCYSSSKMGTSRSALALLNLD